MRMTLNVKGAWPGGGRICAPSQCGTKGPRLAPAQLAVLRETCRTMLVDEGAELTAWVQGFEAIRATVSTLEREFRSGMPLAGESASEFHGLQRHKALLGEGPLREHLSLYYREVVQGILVDDLLARIIARYDEAFYLSAAMGNLLDDGEMAEFLPILTSSYENFLVLKDYFVLACTKGLEEWPLAVSRR